MIELEVATAFAIFAAKQSASQEVSPDHLLLGCLRAISRFGVVTLGAWSVDLEALGVDWVRQPDTPPPKVAYSQESVELFDRAAGISNSMGQSKLNVSHLLAAFANEEGGLMGTLKRMHGITSASWRAAIAQIGWNESSPAEGVRLTAEPKVLREYLTPDEAAEALGIHVQTMRAYIRSERLPAFRLAGERAIRILRSDLAKVLEPLRGDRKEV